MIDTTRIPAITFVIAIFVSCVAGQSVPVSGPIYSTKEAISESIKSVPCDRDLRLEGVRKLFLAAGATDDEIKIEKFDKDKISNLVVRKKGKTTETVVIGAHYDRTSHGCGVTIIAHIFGTLQNLTTNKSYTFVAFDKEEEGLKGSRAMVKKIPDTERLNICAMVNFDSFGQAYPMALRNASSSKLLDLAEKLAKQNEMTFNSVSIDGASSDSEAFREKKIPAITMSGLGNNWTEILHSGNDNLDKVSMDSIYLGYRFGLLFLSKIDVAGCGDYK